VLHVRAVLRRGRHGTHRATAPDHTVKNPYSQQDLATNWKSGTSNSAAPKLPPRSGSVNLLPVRRRQNAANNIEPQPLPVLADALTAAGHDDLQVRDRGL